MAFKVNYGLKKAERDRAKKAKKEAKARDRDGAALQPDGSLAPPDTDEPGAEPSADDAAHGTAVEE